MHKTPENNRPEKEIEYLFSRTKTQRANRIVDYGIFYFESHFSVAFLPFGLHGACRVVSLPLVRTLWLFFFNSALPTQGWCRPFNFTLLSNRIDRKREKKKGAFVWLFGLVGSLGSLGSLGWVHPRFCRWQRAKVQRRIPIVEYKRAEILWQNKYTLLHVPLRHDVWWDGHPAARRTRQVSITFFCLVLPERGTSWKPFYFVFRGLHYGSRDSSLSDLWDNHAKMTSYNK